MDYLPLVLLALVLIGAAVLFPYLRRLKRAAKETLEASKGLERRLQSFQRQQASAAQDPALPDREPQTPPRDDPWA